MLRLNSPGIPNCSSASTGPCFCTRPVRRPKTSLPDHRHAHRADSPRSGSPRSCVRLDRGRSGRGGPGSATPSLAPTLVVASLGSIRAPSTAEMRKRPSSRGQSVRPRLVGGPPPIRYPAPFTATVTGGWQRNVLRAGDVSFESLNEHSGTAFFDHTSQIPGCVQASLFIPIVPCKSADLAGSAHLLVRAVDRPGGERLRPVGDQSDTLKFDNNETWRQQICV